MMKTVERTGDSGSKTQIFSVLLRYGKAAIVWGSWKIHTETALSSIIRENSIVHPLKKLSFVVEESNFNNSMRLQHLLYKQN